VVLLPLLAIGSEAAHALLGLVAPPGYLGAELFDGRVGTQAFLPLLLSLAVVVVVAGLVTASADSRNLHTSRFLIAALPLVAFTIQEYVEYAIGHGAVSWTVAAHPAFAYGLALQLPFAVIAFLAARLVLVLADAVSALFAPPRRARLDFHPVLATGPGAIRPRRGRPSGDARFNRGPPQPITV
jgi:hypothetical protein